MHDWSEAESRAEAYEWGRRDGEANASFDPEDWLAGFACAVFAVNLGELNQHRVDVSNSIRELLPPDTPEAVRRYLALLDERAKGDQERSAIAREWKENRERVKRCEVPRDWEIPGFIYPDTGKAP